MVYISKKGYGDSAAVEEKKEKKYFLIYGGLHQELKISPIIGKVVPGKEYEVPKSLYDALRREPDWKGIER